MKFFYGIPNSQNPSGRTYSQENRKAVAEILRETNTVFYEDDAFGELFFDAKPRLPGEKITFRTRPSSRDPSPRSSLRGCGSAGSMHRKEIITQFNVVKQAADLHSNFLSQKILHRYLTTHDLDAHIRKIVAVYSPKVPTDVRSLR